MADADQVIDLLNNQIGRRIGDENKTATPFGFALYVINEFEKNGLYVASPNSEGGVNINRTKLTEEEVRNAKSRLMELGNDGLTRQKDDSNN